jgi:acyl-CoA synthetase (AMP-forming)/AMP-acid ligase II
MRIADPPLPLDRVAEFTKAGYWRDTTSNDELERQAKQNPEKFAIVDARGRLSYAEYYRRAQRLAAHFIGLGLTADDVIAIQLPNWSEFAIAINAAMLAGVPFCQFHSDFRSREVEFILRFTEASALIVPREFRGFDYLEMVAELRPKLPRLKHVLVVGDDVPAALFDLRTFLEAGENSGLSDEQLRRRRPHPNSLMRTAFTSGTTGDPKAVLHLHNTTNCAGWFLNEGQRITSDSVLLVFLPVGLNWGLFNVLQALFAGCTLVLQDIFRAEDTLAIIERERVTHFCCAPAHLVALVNAPALEQHDLSSLQVVMTGGASCPIEVIRAVRARLPCHLLEMYGMLEVGSQAHTTLEDDAEAVCGLVGKPLAQMGVIVVDDSGKECPPGATGEILTRGPSVMVGYYNNPEANARSLTADGWFHTGDLGVFNESGYLKIVGRKKELIIRGGANIHPREIEEVLYQHPKVRDAAVVGVPDDRLGERVCACIVPKSGESLSFGEMIDFLKPQIATYKLPEFLEILSDLPRTPTGKIQKTPLRDMVMRHREARAERTR